MIAAIKLNKFRVPHQIFTSTKKILGKLGRNSNKEAETKEHGFKNSRKKTIFVERNYQKTQNKKKKNDHDDIMII